MNRVNPARSHPFIHPVPKHCFQALLLVIGIHLVPPPAWSLPVSHSAIDLVDQMPLKNGLIAEYTASSLRATGKDQQLFELTTQTIPYSFKKDFANEDTSHFWNAEEHTELKIQNPELKTQNSLAQRHEALLKTPSSPTIDLDPKLIEGSPVLQRWLKQVPDVLADIKRDPSFRTRLRLGYTQFPSSKQAGGINIGLEDVFVERSGVTLNINYQTAFNGAREAWGGDLRYYTRPLGSVINIAPVLGYRHLETTRYSTDGVHVGLRLLLVPSRTGAADLAVTQSWVAPYGEKEVGLTTLTFGYALTHNLRLSTDLQKQNSRFRSDSSVSVGLEWLF